MGRLFAAAGRRQIARTGRERGVWKAGRRATHVLSEVPLRGAPVAAVEYHPLPTRTSASPTKGPSTVTDEVAQ